YISILQRGLVPAIQSLSPEHPTTYFYFQQDNDPKHKARATMQWLKDNNILMLP
ncbi:hypothetical protein L218DRAFT_877337, partial [Marasmius fiardii PR-910]